MKRVAGLLVLVCLGLGTSACPARPANLTPQAQVAFSVDQVVQRVNEFETAAIAANAEGALSTSTTRLIVDFCVTADKTMQSAPLGWQAAVNAAWVSLKQQLPVPLSATLQAVVGTVDSALAAVGMSK